MYFDEPLTSESYTGILSGPLANFLEDEVSLRDLSRMWYQNVLTPAHKSTQPCTFSAQTFDFRIIGYGGQREGYPRSPDLSPLDFFFWGFLKSIVYERESTSKSDILNRISMQVCDTNYIAKATGGVSDASSVLHFCGRQSF
ncbi:uncharacterized protein TNCV_2679221 [Trichonephila clavipes]|nr:uncharacterized protein TNCV_2679221 [Trichonephila clavipes]